MLLEVKFIKQKLELVNKKISKKNEIMEKDCLVKEYYSNGNIMFEYQLDEFLNYHGSFKEYYSNGNIWEEYTYIKGEIHGLYERFFENGNICIKCIYINSRLSGIYKNFKQSKRNNFIEQYKKGEKHGIRIEFIY